MTAADIRCDWKLHGRLNEGMIEIRCRSSRCGYRPGVVVLHRFNSEDGTLIDTRVFRDPEKKGFEE